MEDQIAGVGPEALVSGGRRSSPSREQDDVERLSVDESLSDIERYKLFLSPSADVLQQQFAVSSLPSLFHSHGSSALRELAGVCLLPPRSMQAFYCCFLVRIDGPCFAAAFKLRGSANLSCQLKHI